MGVHMGKLKPWSSSSKWFIPFHLLMMVITAFIIYFFL